MTSSSRASEFFDARDLVQVKYEMVRRVRVDGAAGDADRGARSGSPGRRTTRPPRRWTATGWAALVPAKPGPRRAHKLTDEVIAYAQPAARAGSRRCDRRSWPMRSRPTFADQGAPAIGGAGAGPR